MSPAGLVSPSQIKFVPKGWGYERWLMNGPLYCAKELVFAPGRSCSYHYHKLKTETFLIKSGQINLLWADQLPVPTNEMEYLRGEFRFTKLQTGDVFHVPPMTRHQIRAVTDAVILEFSTQHFDDDSYRLVPGD